MIAGNIISGNLKNVTYTGFGDEEASTPGHYLALSFESKNADSITTKIIGGDHGDVDCTEDKFCVYRIKNKDTQQIEIKATKDGKTNTKTYSLAGLTLEN